MKASTVESTASAPPCVERLEPSDFADTWESKPKKGVAVGLRLISDRAENQARKEAREESDGGSKVDEYNDALVANLIGAALCHPHDVHRDPVDVPFPKDMIRNVLTARAIRRLFHKYDATAAVCSPSARMATDDELVALIEHIVTGNLSNRARRLLAAALDEIEHD